MPMDGGRRRRNRSQKNSRGMKKRTMGRRRKYHGGTGDFLKSSMKLRNSIGLGEYIAKLIDNDIDESSDQIFNDIIDVDAKREIIVGVKRCVVILNEFNTIRSTISSSKDLRNIFLSKLIKMMAAVSVTHTKLKLSKDDNPDLYDVFIHFLAILYFYNDKIFKMEVNEENVDELNTSINKCLSLLNKHIKEIKKQAIALPNIERNVEVPDTAMRNLINRYTISSKGMKREDPSEVRSTAGGGE
jgi:hypothetical protein